jgi:HPt (histidine-containing phosphotransfer) domain-containing protein
MDPAAQNALEAALERLWIQFQPQIEERLAVLDSAAHAFAANDLAPELQETAAATAHKLAGALGTFGLMRGTEISRELESTYTRALAPDPALAARLLDAMSELRTVVSSRK